MLSRLLSLNAGATSKQRATALLSSPAGQWLNSSRGRTCWLGRLDHRCWVSGAPQGGLTWVSRSTIEKFGLVGKIGQGRNCGGACCLAGACWDVPDLQHAIVNDAIIATKAGAWATANLSRRDFSTGVSFFCAAWLRPYELSPTNSHGPLRIITWLGESARRAGWCRCQLTTPWPGSGQGLGLR